MRVHKEGLTRQIKTLDNMAPVVGGLRQARGVRSCLVEVGSDTASREKDRVKTTVIYEGRVSVPHTGDTPVDVGRCHKSVVPVFPNIC